MFVPKSIVCLREGYTREKLLRDVIAGVVVGIVALPLALAFAIASGVPPERGLYTAIVAGFLISALGGSRVQIGGPTGAFVVILSGITAKYGIDGLQLATLMAGVMLLAIGVAKLGAVIKFIRMMASFRSKGFVSARRVSAASRSSRARSPAAHRQRQPAGDTRMLSHAGITPPNPGSG